MHIRFSTCIGIDIVSEGSSEVIGNVMRPLIDPDRGIIAGFFVHALHIPFSQQPFLSSQDILHWGTHVSVRDTDVICPVTEIIRLQALLDDERSILGQRMRTESGRRLGTCKDIQFHTEELRLEWLFPKKIFRWGMPVSVSEIIEVLPEAVIVRDPPLVEADPVAATSDLSSNVPVPDTVIREQMKQ